MKELPKLYTNTFNKQIDNSQNYTKIKEYKENINLSKYELNKKINNIFKSKNYIYKIRTIISTKNGIRNETLIGKTNNNLITINNELININDIIDIKKDK